MVGDKFIRLQSWGEQVLKLRNRHVGNKYAGLNPNIWRGSVSLDPDFQGDPTENLAFYQIPGVERFNSFLCNKFDDGEEPTLFETAKKRVYGKKRKTGTVSRRTTRDLKLSSFPEDFYHDYPWVDWSILHHGPEEFRAWLEKGGINLRGLSNRLVGWASSLMPLSEEYPKYLSIVFGDTELVCRTKADRARPFRNASIYTTIFKCEVCGNLIIPNVTVVVGCYVHDDNASDEIRSKWAGGYIRVCFIHFLTHGKDRNRKGDIIYNFGTEEWSTKRQGDNASLY